ncbi:MAG: 4Fe-4S dicluster domain-containing protein [Coriobacteriales bacterium]|jgi:Fe-S-cluster-containing hydrogenase component 2
MDEFKCNEHVVQYSRGYSLCAGCNSCEAVCSLTHDGINGPTRNRLFVKRGDTLDMTCEILTCQQCDDHPCYEACPKKDSAFCIDENGISYINEENCIGCGLCVKACRFEVPRINMARDKVRKKWRAKKCDLCRTRPEGPACVQYCPVRCLGVDTAHQEDVVDPEVTEKVTLGEIAGAGEL